jgi:anti-sigma factor RsiW
MSALPPIREEDLHAFVDGECEAAIAEAVLRHLAESPADQARIAAWRRQNARLRATFAELAHAPQPSKPASPPGLHVVAPPPPRQRPARRRGWYAAALFLAFGLGLTLGTALWLEGLPQAWHAATRPSTHVAGAADVESARVVAPIAQALTEALPHAEGSVPSEPGDQITLQSPNLAAIGLELTGAHVMARQSEPLGCFVFAGGDERFVLCIAEVPNGAALDIRKVAAPATAVIAWQEGARLYALSGSVSSDRLVEVAHAIRVALGAAKDEPR